ncbi:efflux RND transporter permease subunit [Bacteriovorax sp. DB6_IX]|uniref:efflux RND transporter permease subunit n=1 Tax=Bacteriovorax sp. DB6_IX TaxID=1353530 RepID=UPI000389FCD3|nr:efflux RND transporter permease subunit [Bacteriovorax sp. DB6_IX]EQC52144.1 MMPL family protein [Bacteriovorax sp. DB6_IX]
MKKGRENYGFQLGKVVTKRPILISLLAVVISVLLGSGMGKITMSSDYRYFFGKDNPQRLAFEKLQNVYSKDDNLIIVLTPKSKEVFTQKNLKAIEELTQAAWKVPYSTRVDSITNFQHTVAIEDDLIVRNLVDDSTNLNTAKLSQIKEVALNEPLLKNRLINASASVTGVNIQFNFPGKNPMEIPEVAQYTRKMTKEFQERHPQFEVKLSGLAMMNNAFNEAGMNDMQTLTPIMYGIILFFMVIMLRSFFAVVATFHVILFSVISGMGLAGFLGIPITPPSSIAPTVIVTLAIADSIHILKGILYSMSLGHSKKDSIIESMAANLRPVFLTSFTTAIGFLSLNFSDTPPFHDLGNITAMGVTAAFLLSITLLPALVTVLPLRAPKKIENQSSLWQVRFANFITRNKKPVMLSTVFVTAFLAVQVPKIVLNDQFVKYFDETIQFRTDTEYTMKNLAGIYQVNYDLSSGESGGISNPSYLEKVEEFTQWLRKRPNVTHVSTITDTFKRLNKNMHADKEEYYKLPASRELSAQYLLLYEMSLPYGLDLNNQIDVDKASTRVIVTYGDIETKQILDYNEMNEQWIRNNMPKHMHTLGSSPTIMFSHISERNVKSMAWGTLLAFGLITITLIVSLRSWKYGIISLLPNVIPAIISYGLWSLFVGKAGFAIAIVSSVTLGIVVDDTVHFLSKYVRAIKEKGMSPKDAIEYAFSSVGSALVVTSIILTIGFSVLIFSPFKMNMILGILSALTIMAALIIDFTFLPAVLALMDKSEQSTGQKGENMKLKNALATISITLLAIGLGSQVKAETNKGLWVAQQIDKANNGFVNQSANVEMILLNKQGQKSTRLMKIKTLEVQGDGDKSLTTFDSPRDVKGTSFLSFSHATTADDQWLYLPALKRVKRISSNNKSGPFMGSEFAYEDISSQEIEKYTYKYLETQAGNHLIERYPVDKNSGYTKQIVLVDGKNWNILNIKFYDRKDSLLKTLVYEDYKKYDNGQWRADLMHMTNHQSGKSTKLIWKDYQFNQNISTRDFNKNALKRLR